MDTTNIFVKLSDKKNPIDDRKTNRFRKQSRLAQKFFKCYINSVTKKNH